MLRKRFKNNLTWYYNHQPEFNLLRISFHPTKMDIEFIEEEHRDNIFKIMELCNCEMNEAYQLYNNNGCNVQKAVQAKFNSLNNQGSMSRDYEQPYNKPLSQGNNNNPNLGNNLGAQRFQQGVGQQDEYEGFKMYKESGMSFARRYDVRREESGIVKGVLSFFKSTQNPFKKQLQSYIGRRSNLDLSNGSLSEALQSVSKEKFPLIVHALDVNRQISVVNNVKRVYSDEYLVQMMNQQFKNYGLNTKEYQLQSYLKYFVNLKNDANSLLIFRVNINEEIVLIAKIPLTTTSVEEIKKKFKQVKSNCINLQMEEMHFQKRYMQQKQGNFDYQKPMSLAEKRKLQQDRQIRKKQEEQFYASMQQPKQEQQKPTYGHSSTSNKPKVSPIKKDTRAEARQERRKIRESLKIYNGEGVGILSIKLRLPSSQTIKLSVHERQAAQYLYDYVLSREEDLGFEDDESRRVFDIIEPYEKLNLSERKQQQLGKIFEGENMLTLVVNEKVD